MVKFKVGDRVSLTGKKRTAPGFSGIRKITGSKEGFLWGDDGDENYKGIILEVNGGWYAHDALKLESSVHAIQLNHQYTSKNGQKWECIAIKGDVCWLASACGEGDAYRFLTNGENLSQAGGVWDIKWEPVVEWVDTKGSWAKAGCHPQRQYNYAIRFPLIDGEPDFTQASVTPV